MSTGAPRHVLVVANETVDAPTLREALAAHGDDLQVTVVSPVNEPKRAACRCKRRSPAGAG